MNITKELIDAFFRHRCSADDAKQVAAFLKEHPEEVEKYLPEKDWHETVDYSLMPADFWEKQWRRIQRKKGAAGRRRVLKQVSAAAAILFFFSGLLWYLMSPQSKSGESELRKNEVYRTISNTGENAIRVVLDDSSVVVLQPDATIVYRKNFDVKKRDIFLKDGRVMFTVSKDRTKPFTVYSGNISTTAVGTRFSVSYSMSDNTAIVHLYEGNVFVNSPHANASSTVFLLPGDELSYLNETVQVSHAIPQDKVAEDAGNTAPAETTGRISDELALKNRGRKEIRSDHVSIPLWYRFKKEPLADVFNDLAGLYGVKIEFNKNDLSKKYFAGEFQQKDSIGNILKIIGDLNHLQVERINDKHYRIK